jgi:hypothetical protein
VQSEREIAQAAVAERNGGGREPIAVLDRQERADQGNPEITVWCPKCEERVVPLRSGACGWCDTELASDPEGGGIPEPEAPAPPVAARPRRAPREDSQVAEWRRTEIFEWLLDDGPKTLVEIRDHFNLADHVAQQAVRDLRITGHLQRTGQERQGPRGGRPSPEFEAVEPVRADTSGEPETPAQVLGDAGDEIPYDGKPPTISEQITDRAEKRLTIDPRPFPEREGATEETRRIGEEVDAELERVYGGDDGGELEPEFMNHEERITVHEELVVRYIGSLIDWVGRSAYVRDDGPPEHVFERIERLLGIQDGAA